MIHPHHRAEDLAAVVVLGHEKGHGAVAAVEAGGQGDHAPRGIDIAGALDIGLVLEGADVEGQAIGGKGAWSERSSR